MLVFGFASGLPYALLIGTLNAWLGQRKVDLATIGVLSWIGLSYSFKFLWSPLVDRVDLPLLARFGRRKSWIVLCQATLIVAFGLLAVTDPTVDLGRFAIWAVLAALASATQDIAIDAWRIDVADGETTVELLSTIYQFGYRIASLVGGAGALILAARSSWPTVYLVMAGLLAVAAGVAAFAPDTRRLDVVRSEADAPPIALRLRIAALVIVTAGWLSAITAIGAFMVRALGDVAGARPSASAFIKDNGAWIVAVTVLLPLAVAAATNALAPRQPPVLPARPSSWRAFVDHLYVALVAPLAELAGRMGWGVLIVVGLILTYRLCDNVWGAFALPFYLDTLHYTNDEVAFASKIFGVGMTIAGIGVGAALFAWAGRMPTLLLGALLPALGNLLYSNLAAGGRALDAFASATGLSRLAAMVGSDDRMVRLMLAISGENLAAGVAGAAFVAYLSSIVSRRYTAVQYALLSSLTFLVGSLGRGVAGEAFDRLGHAVVFRYTAALGLVAAGFVLLEWWRVSRASATHDNG